MLTSYENVRLSRLRSTPNIVQIAKAPVPSETNLSRSHYAAGMMGAMAGFMIMGAIAFLIEYLDDTLKTPEDVTQRLHVPVIGLIGELDHHKGRKHRHRTRGLCGRESIITGH